MIINNKFIILKFSIKKLIIIFLTLFLIQTAIPPFLSSLFIHKTYAVTVKPPKIDMRKLPIDRVPAPKVLTKLNNPCYSQASLNPNTNPQVEPYFKKIFNYQKLWAFSTGKNQIVAVIDTGVSKNPRLGKLIAGGDYVKFGGNGTEDCDKHGTIVAGLIAARPSETDNFAGIAPGATIMTIRNLSNNYTPEHFENNENLTLSSGYGELDLLAAAIVRATNANANIINISQAVCVPQNTTINDGSIGAAIKYAYDRDVVVVIAAGNQFNGKNCPLNPLEPDPLFQAAHGWNNINTLVTPARFSEYALVVAAVDKFGNYWNNSIAGPWVNIAAYGTDIISLNPDYSTRLHNSELVDTFITTNGPEPMVGTSFAAPFVAGLAALLREKYPNYSAAQIINLIETTAVHPGRGRNNAIGYGIIDPLAALTYTVHNPAKSDLNITTNIPVELLIPDSNIIPKKLTLIISIILFANIILAWFGTSVIHSKKETYRDNF